MWRPAHTLFAMGKAGRHILFGATFRIRLSDKTSRLGAPSRTQSNQSIAAVKVREWTGPAPFTPEFVPGKTRQPTALLIFGNQQGGTPLMECAQTAAIDLPLKALAWEGASGQVWLGCSDPQYLAARHRAKERVPLTANLRKAPDGLPGGDQGGAVMPLASPQNISGKSTQINTSDY
jgi:hypothetical protein